MTPAAPRGGRAGERRQGDAACHLRRALARRGDQYFIPPLSPPGSQRDDAKGDAPMPADEDDAMDEDEPSPGAVAAAAKKASPPGILKPTPDAAEAPARAVTSAGAAVGTKVPAAPSASDAYASLMADDAGEVAEDVAPATIADRSLPLDVDDSLPYLLDAHEDINSPGRCSCSGACPWTRRRRTARR